MRQIALLFASFLLICSCGKYELNDVKSAEAIQVSTTVEQHEDSATKTSLGTGNSIIWKAGDKLSILSSNNREGGDEFTLSGGFDTDRGDFTGTLTDGSDAYYALYPYSLTSSYTEEGVLTFFLPQEQTYAAGTFANNANPMVGTFDKSTNAIHFKNVCGVLKLSLTGSETVTKIALSDNSGTMLWGDASLTADSKMGTDEQAFALAGGSNTIYLKDINVMLSSSATTFYFVVPKGAFAHGFTAYVYTDSGIYTYLDTWKDNTISRSKIMAMPGLAAVTPTAKDLGGCENSYIVPCAGTYKFLGAIGDLSTLTWTVPSPAIASVDVLWETFNTTETPTVGDVIKNVTVSDNEISFTATGHSGNAVIAARNSGGDIIWSWHIWVPEQQIEMFPYPSGTPFMNMDLGALTSNPSNGCNSYGLLYQYGRKDPFTAHDAYLSKTAVSSTFDFDAAFAEKSAETTVDYSVSHPTSFIGKSDLGKSEDWLYSGPDASIRWSKSTKTIFDPSPKGYKVASRDDFYGLNSYPISSFTTGARGSSFEFGHITNYHTASNYRHRYNGICIGDDDFATRNYSLTCSETMYLISKVSIVEKSKIYIANANSIRCCAFVEDVLSGETEGN